MKGIFMGVLLFVLFMFPGSCVSAEEPVKIEEVVVTATRYEETLSGVPAHVTVITEEDIKNSTSQNIPDLLRTSAGIQVNDIGGNRRNITVDIRGFGETAGSNTLVLVDGRRVNQADLSGTDWTQIPLDRVEKIEIVRGGRGGVLYGDNASGGVVNIITKKGKKLQTGGEASFGSYNSSKVNAYASGDFQGHSFALSGSYLSSDGFRDNSGTEAKDAGMDLNFHAGDFVALHISSGYHKDRTGLPGALRESDFRAGASRTDTVNPRDFAAVEDYYFQGGPEVYFLDDSMARLDISFRKRAFSSFASFVGGEFSGDTVIDTVTVSPQLLFKHSITSMENTFVAGLDYQDAEEDILNESVYFDISSRGRFDLQKKNYGYYLHDEIAAGDHVLISGGYRYDRTDFSFEPGTPEHVVMDEDAFTAGISYNFFGKSRAFLSFSRSFRYPLLDELFSFFTNQIDTGLLPQRSDDYELGVRYYFTDSSYVQADIFRVITGDEIFFNPGTFRNENLDGTTRRDGLELSFSARPIEWLALNGSYTYQDSVIEDGTFRGHDVPNVPHHRASLGTVLSPLKGFSFALQGVYVGRRPFISDFENAFERQEDHIVLNGKIKYQWKKITAFLDVNNITDEEYSEYGVLGGFPAEKAFYPSPEMNVRAGLSVDF